MLTEKEKQIIDQKMGFVKKTIKSLEHYDNPVKLAIVYTVKNEFLNEQEVTQRNIWKKLAFMVHVVHMHLFSF